MKGLNFTRQAG